MCACSCSVDTAVIQIASREGAEGGAVVSASGASATFVCAVSEASGVDVKWADESDHKVAHGDYGAPLASDVRQRVSCAGTYFRFSCCL